MLILLSTEENDNPIEKGEFAEYRCFKSSVLLFFEVENDQKLLKMVKIRIFERKNDWISNADVAKADVKLERFRIPWIGN